MSRFGNAIISIFRQGEKRISSQEFEHAVNQVLLSDTVADATKKPIITPEGSLAISAMVAIVSYFYEKYELLTYQRWLYFSFLPDGIIPNCKKCDISWSEVY